MTLDADSNISSTHGTNILQSHAPNVSEDQSWCLYKKYQGKRNRWNGGTQHYRHTSMTTMLNHLKAPIEGARNAEAAGTDLYDHLSNMARPKCEMQDYLDSHYLAEKALGTLYDRQVHRYIDRKTRTEMIDDYNAATFFAFSQIVTNGGPGSVLPKNPTTKEMRDVYFEVNSKIKQEIDNTRDHERMNEAFNAAKELMVPSTQATAPEGTIDGSRR